MAGLFKGRAGPAPPPRWALAAALCAALLASLTPGAGAQAFAVDLGASLLKVSLVSHGRQPPVSIVTNELSRRKTPALVGFVEGGHRAVGEEAASLEARHPGAFVGRALDLLGRSPDHPRIAELQGEGLLPTRGVEAQPGRPHATQVRFPDGTVQTAEALVGSLLEHARDQAAVAADDDTIRDAVLVTPAWLSPEARLALLDAARLVDLNVLGLVRAGVSAGLQWGVSRAEELLPAASRTPGSPSAVPSHVLLYDAGAGSTEASVVAYTPGQLDVVATAWEEGVGTQSLEAVVADLAASKHADATSPDRWDPRDHPKAYARIQRAASKALKVLSANADARLSVEDIRPGEDLRAVVSRDELERGAAAALSRSAGPALRALELAGVAPADLAAVELLGGGSRVPAVQAALRAALGGRALDRHLDADEASVLGAGLIAANRSTQFRLRRFGAVDRSVYAVSFEVTPLGDASAPLVDAQGRPLASQGTLLKAGRRLPARRAVPLPAGVDAVEVAFFRDPSAASGAGGSTGAAEPLGAVRVTGVAEALAGFANVTKISLHVRVDADGIFRADSADASVVEAIPTQAGAKAAPAAAEGGAEPSAAEEGEGDEGAGDKAAGGEGAAGGKAAGGEPARKLRTRRVPLTASPASPAPWGRMSPQDVAAARQSLAHFRELETSKREAARARNDLEEYVIAASGWLRQEDEFLLRSTTAEARLALSEQLEEADDWLYEGGASAPADEHRARLSALRRVGDELRLAAEDLEARPGAVRAARELAEGATDARERWLASKPWLPAGDVVEVERRARDLTQWLDEALEKQAGRPDHEVPAFRAHEVSLRADRLHRLVQRLEATPEPAAEVLDAAVESGAAGTGAPGAADARDAADADAADAAAADADGACSSCRGGGSPEDPHADVHVGAPGDATPIPPHDEIKRASKRFQDKRDEL